MCPGNLGDKIVCRSLPLKLSMSLPVNAGRRSFTFEKFLVISVFPLPGLPAMSENPVRRKYLRHIDIRRYFVRDLVSMQVLKLVPLRTNLMVADARTKSLPAPAHAKRRDVMFGRVPFCVRTLRLRASRDLKTESVVLGFREKNWKPFGG